MTKIKDAKEKHPEFMVDIVQLLSDRDPSGTNKYLAFMIKVSAEFVQTYFSNGSFLDQSFVQMFNLINEFEKFSQENIIENKDIYSYPNVDAIEEALKDAREAVELRNAKTKETLVLFEDKNRILVKPLTGNSSTIYGKNTKWCTSTEGGGSFTSYASQGTLVYFIWKHPPQNLKEEWRKLAFNRKTLQDSQIIWDAKDAQIGGGDTIKLFTIMGADIMDIIIKEFDLCIPNTSIRKSDDGRVMLDKNLFDNKEFAKMKKEIEIYISSLQGNKEKNIKVPETFEKTDAEKNRDSAPNLEFLIDINAAEGQGVEVVAEDEVARELPEFNLELDNTEMPEGAVLAVNVDGVANLAKEEEMVEEPKKEMLDGFPFSEEDLNKMQSLINTMKQRGV